MLLPVRSHVFWFFTYPVIIGWPLDIVNITLFNARFGCLLLKTAGFCSGKTINLVEDQPGIL